MTISIDSIDTARECGHASGYADALSEIASVVRRMKTQAMDTLRSARAAKRWDRAEEAQANANALQWVLDEIEKKAASAAVVSR